MFIADVPYAETLRDHMVRSVQFALEEDIGSGDITAELIPAEHNSVAHVISRENGVLCGREWFEEVFRQVDPTVLLSWRKTDGDELSQNGEIVHISGNTRSILTAERTALNFLQTLSAVATSANQAVTNVKGSSNPTIIVKDTRKTLPGLRLAQKYAVIAGGAQNHRLGLYDEFLIKENHIAACGSVTKAIQTARAVHPGKTIEIEVETLEQLKEAIECTPDVIMLDNFGAEEIRKASSLKPEQIKFEYSGNITIDSLKKSETHKSIDIVSLGEITKSCRAIDLSLKIIEM